jgi:hypothetical protein
VERGPEASGRENHLIYVTTIGTLNASLTTGEIRDGSGFWFAGSSLPSPEMRQQTQGTESVTNRDHALVIRSRPSSVRHEICARETSESREGGRSCALSSKLP